MENSPLVTYVFCPIHEKYIRRALYSLYKYQDPKTFKVIVIDQTKDRFSKEVMDYIMPLTHLYIHPARNLGFAKAMNEGAIHGLRWGSKYICLANDDLEIINRKHMDGIEGTFGMADNILGVVPMSIRAAGWGYGVDYNPDILLYKEEYTDEDYDYLLKGDFSSSTARLPKTFPRNMGGTVVDGAAFIMLYLKREAYEKVGFFDEHYFPGSGEDYDYSARLYSKGLRLVSTSYCWIWHWWTKSKDLFASGELEDPYYKPYDKPYWNNLGDLWDPRQNEGHEFDVWGMYHKTDEKGNDIKIPLKRVPEVFVDQI